MKDKEQEISTAAKCLGQGDPRGKAMGYQMPAPMEPMSDPTE